MAQPRTYRVRHDARTGKPYARPAHPCIPGRRLYVTAATEFLVRERLIFIDRLRADVRYGVRSRDEVIALLERTGPEHRPDPTAQDLLRAYAESQPHRHTRRKIEAAWRHQLGPFLGDTLRARDLTEAKMRAWETWARAEGYEASTCRLAVADLAAAWSLALAKKIVHGPRPWGAWKPKKGPRREYEKATSVNEIIALVKAALARDVASARRGDYHPDLAWRIVVLVFVGMRKGEGSALGWDDLELDARLATAIVRRNALDGWRVDHPEWTRPLSPTKGRSAHKQLLHPAALLVLRWQREALRARGWYRDDGPVFPGPHGAWRCNAECIKPDVFRAVVEAAGLPDAKDWVMHSLRHSMASLEMRAGASLQDLQDRAGWGSLEMAERYARSTKRKLVASRIDGGKDPTAPLPEPEPATQSLIDVLIEGKAAIERAAKEGASPELRARRERIRALAGKATHEKRRRFPLAPDLAALDLGQLARLKDRPRAQREAERRARKAYQDAHAAVLREALPVGLQPDHVEARRQAKLAKRTALRSWARACQRARKDFAEGLEPAPEPKETDHGSDERRNEQHHGDGRAGEHGPARRRKGR